MKLKMDEQGNVVVADGKPVYVHDDGKEIPFDAVQAMSKIKELNGESKSYREQAEQFKTEVSSLKTAYDGLDAAAARKALETIKNLDDKKLIDAGEVETIKKGLAASFEENLNNTKKSYETKIQELTTREQKLLSNIDELLVLGAFERSDFLREKTMLTPDIAYASFKNGLRVEYDQQGKPFVVGYLDNEKIFSRKDPGKFADPEECIEAIIMAHPMKERFLKGSGSQGSGGGSGDGGGGDDLQAKLAAAQKANDVAAMVSLKRQIAERNANK